MPIGIGIGLGLSGLSATHGGGSTPTGDADGLLSFGDNTVLWFMFF